MLHGRTMQEWTLEDENADMDNAGQDIERQHCRDGQRRTKCPDIIFPLFRFEQCYWLNINEITIQNIISNLLCSSEARYPLSETNLHLKTFSVEL